MFEATMRDLRTGKVTRSFQSDSEVEAANLLQKHIHIKHLGDFKFKPATVYVERGYVSIVNGKLVIKPTTVHVEQAEIEKIVEGQ